MSRKESTKSKPWWKALDEAKVREAFDEATVDAYGDDEQHTGLLTAIGDELQFSFKAKVLGQVMNITGMQWPNDDAYGLDLVCWVDGEEETVAARNAELLEPLPDGHLFLAAYLDWKSRF